MTTKLEVMGHNERFGRAALRLAAATMLVLLVLGATIKATGAEPGGPLNGTTKDDFIQGCRSVGGRVVDLGDVVRCDYRDASVICSWSLNQCWIVPTTFSQNLQWEFGRPPDLPPLYPDPEFQSPGTHGDTSGGVATDAGEASGGSEPSVITTRTAKPGTVLLLDDEDGRP